MENQIRIGVMGCANIAQRSLIPAFISHSSYKLVAVASRSDDKAKAFAQRFGCKGVVGYENLLNEDIDLVYVPLPTGLHEEWVSKCLHAGKHVFVEKSFGMNDKSTNTMLDIARTNRLVAMENFMFPYHSQHAYLLKLLQSGAIGSIRNFKASFGFPPLPDDNFRYNAEAGGGALLDAGAYTIKAAQVVLGEELEFLSATRHAREITGVDIAGSAQFVYKQEVPVQLAWGFDNFYQCGLEIWGSKGKITTNRTFTAAPGFQPTIKVETAQKIDEHLLPADDHFAKILAVLHNRIVEGQYLITAEETAGQSFLLSQILDKANRYEFT